MSDKPIEQVLAVPTWLFHQAGRFDGYRNDYAHYLPQLLTPELSCYLPKPAAEENPAFKQIIPYCILRCKEPITAKTYYLSYKRGNGQGEKRLHAKRSIGIGGHMNPPDRCDHSLYYNGMIRELHEELQLGPGQYSQKIVGLVNEDVTPVGKVHLGLVHVFDLVVAEVAGNEDSMHDVKWMSIEELMDGITEYELWSQMCINAIWDNRLELPEKFDTLPGKPLQQANERVAEIGEWGTRKESPNPINPQLTEKIGALVNLVEKRSNRHFTLEELVDTREWVDFKQIAAACK